MIFWQSSEATKEGYNLISLFVREIEKKINENFENIILESEYQEWKWAFIAIIMNNDDYKEIRKRNIKKKVLEFRLKIDIEKLKKLDEKDKIVEYFETLRRCFNSETIKKLKIPLNDIKLIDEVLDKSLKKFI